MADPLDLDLGERLSNGAPAGAFITTIRLEPVATYRLRVANFGEASIGERNVSAWVIGDCDAFESRRGRQSTAITEADLVAWCLTNREELIRLARIGAVHAAARGES